MEGLIALKKFDDVVKFLFENPNDKDWNTVIKALKNNDEFKTFFIDYISKYKKPNLLYFFLKKVFSLQNTNKINVNNEVFLFDIFSRIIKDNEKYYNNKNLRNTLITQLINLSIVEEKYLEKLDDFIIEYDWSEEGWLEECFEELMYYNQLGLLFEKKQKYEKSLNFYNQANNTNKINEMKEVIQMIEDSNKLT